MTEPTQADIAQLLTFLPKLYAPGFKPVLRWGGGEPAAPGVYTAAWPEYHPLVHEFMGLISQECWRDSTYDPPTTSAMIRNPAVVQTATLAQIKTMLTFCARGERFGDGFWEQVIESGYLKNVLERLQQLYPHL